MSKSELKGKFIEHLKAAGGIVFAACEAVKISRTTYYNWLNSDAEFKEKCEEINEAATDFVESKLMELINAGDTTAIIFYLKTKGKN